MFVFLLGAYGATYREAPGSALVPWVAPRREQVQQQEQVVITSTTASMFRVSTVVAPPQADILLSVEIFCIELGRVFCTEPQISYWLGWRMGGVLLVEPSMSLIAGFEEFLDNPTLIPYSNSFRTPGVVCNDSLYRCFQNLLF